MAIFPCGNHERERRRLVEPDGTWEQHGGKLRFVDSSGSIIGNPIGAQNYRDVIDEAVQKTSYLKSPYYKPMGIPAGGHCGQSRRRGISARLHATPAARPAARHRPLAR